MKNITMTLSEILDQGDWDMFCKHHGYSEYAVKEGGGHVQVELTIHQAHHLGIIRLHDEAVKPFEDVYTDQKAIPAGHISIEG